MLKRQMYLVDKEAQGEYFRGMILPDVWEKMDHPNVFLIGALEDEKVVGAAVMRLENHRAQLLSIAVEESRRRQGIGTALLKMCVRTLRRTAIQALYTVAMAKETGAFALFASFGMMSSDAGSAYYNVLLKDAAALQVLQNGGNKTCAIEEVSDFMLNRFMKAIFSADPALCERKLFVPKASRFLIENMQITACLLMEKTEEGLSIAWLSSRSKNKLAVLYLLKDALAAAVKEYPEDTKISFTAYDTVVIQLADKLLGEAAQKQPVSEWVLEEYKFRLKDTDLTGWEVN